MQTKTHFGFSCWISAKAIEREVCIRWNDESTLNTFSFDDRVCVQFFGRAKHFMHNSHLVASFITLKCARDIFMHHNNLFHENMRTLTAARGCKKERWGEEEKKNILIFIFAKSWEISASSKQYLRITDLLLNCEL